MLVKRMFFVESLKVRHYNRAIEICQQYLVNIPHIVKKPTSLHVMGQFIINVLYGSLLSS